MEQDHILRARLEAHEALEDAARSLKYQDRVFAQAIAAIEQNDPVLLRAAREALRTQRARGRSALVRIKEAQAGTLGIRVQNSPSPHPQGIGDTHGSHRAAA